ncbi:MAG: UbiA family prenyltransferase [Planctomycetes bacterium]|nr:UbiA family prenyltransferase [Planctomycetota bacterium]
MLGYLQLVRLPTVFTAMADIILGYTLTHTFVAGTDGSEDAPKFLVLLAASCCLYMSGMVFNDVFDLQQDTAERPGRPIPSGRVSRNSAIVLGVVLMTVGIVSAALVTRVSLQVAGLLAVAILSYDGLLKRTPLGPLAMGSCRLLNVLLGASDQLFWTPPGLLVRPQLAAAIGLGVYIVGVTVFARTEAKTSSRWQLGLAQILFNAGIVVLGCLIVAWPVWTWPPRGNGPVAVAMLAVIAFTLNRRALTALADPSPSNVQTTIKLLLLSYVMLDATLVFWKMNDSGPFGTAVALGTAALIVPALLLSRFIPMT